MGLNYAAAKALGIAHLHPLASGGRSREREILDALDPVPKPTDVRADGMNKTEAAFAEVLRCHHRLIRRWEREPVTFRLAGRTRYTPDFGVWPEPASDWRFTLVEIKGFMRDDAAVKLKVAAAMYPDFRWLLVRREGRHGWDVREVTRNGIGTAPIAVSWID